MRNKDEYLQNQLTQKISKENCVFPFLIDNTFQVYWKLTNSTESRFVL